MIKLKGSDDDLFMVEEGVLWTRKCGSHITEQAHAYFNILFNYRKIVMMDVILKIAEM